MAALIGVQVPDLWSRLAALKPVHGGSAAVAGMRQRAERAHDKLRADHPGFTVTLLLPALTGGFSSATSLAAALFVVAQYTHMLVYILGGVWSRVLSWALGLAAGP